MDINPYKPPITPLDGEPIPLSSKDGHDALVAPVLAYTANGNLEAHSVVTWLEHTTYIGNCISEVQRKLDGSK